MRRVILGTGAAARSWGWETLGESCTLDTSFQGVGGLERSGPPPTGLAFVGS